MPDYPPSGPAAGWYTDPANSAQERWWGGVEWTHDTRPLQETAAPPVLTSVPGGGVNPFAGRLPEQTGIGSGLSGPSFSTGTNDFASFNAVGTSPFTSPAPSFAVAPSWNATSSPVPSQQPTNGIATAGLLLSIFGFSLVGIILSSIGLKRAREFEFAGDRAVGRKRSRWGIGLGVTSIVLSIALAVAYVLAWPQIYAFYLEQSGATSSQGEFFDEEINPNAILESDGSPVVYDRTEFEQAVSDGFAEGAGSPPQDVFCSDNVEMVVGATIVCTFSYLGQQHEMITTFTDTSGGYTQSFDGVVQQ